MKLHQFFAIAALYVATSNAVPRPDPPVEMTKEQEAKKRDNALLEDTERSRPDHFPPIVCSTISGNTACSAVFEGNQAPEVKKRDIVELDNFDLAKRDEDLYRGQVFWTNTGRVLKVGAVVVETLGGTTWRMPSAAGDRQWLANLLQGSIHSTIGNGNVRTDLPHGWTWYGKSALT